MKTDQERREFYARLPKRHPNPWHWSRLASRQRSIVIGHKVIRDSYPPPSAPGVVPRADSRIITADELYTFADSQGLSLLVTDESYCCMTEESFAEQVQAQFSNMESIGATGYVAEGWDCEDFAFLMRDLIRVAHHKTPDMPKAGLAVGVFIYTAWSSLNLHAIVCAFIRKGQSFNMVHAEPQSGKIVKLYKEELESCMGVWI